MPGALVRRVFLEDLPDERLSGLGTQFLDQQVESDDRELFRAAWTVGAVSLWPLGFDVGVDGYGAHDDARAVVWVVARS